MHFEPVFRAPLLCLLASVIIPLAFVPKHNVCAIRRASELVLLVRMYYATPAPPPVGDLGPEFESGLDLVLKKKTPLDHLCLSMLLRCLTLPPTGWRAHRPLPRAACTALVRAHIEVGAAAARACRSRRA